MEREPIDERLSDSNFRDKRVVNGAPQRFPESELTQYLIERNASKPIRDKPPPANVGSEHR